MTYAISPRGIGKPVGARSIREDWPLIEGETFTVEEFHEGLVLAEDGISLRQGAPEELTKPVSRNLAAELDAMKADAARSRAAVDVLVGKGTITDEEIEAKHR